MDTLYFLGPNFPCSFHSAAEIICPYHKSDRVVLKNTLVECRQKIETLNSTVPFVS